MTDDRCHVAGCTALVFKHREFCVEHLDPAREFPYCTECGERRTWAGDICHLCRTELRIYEERCDDCDEELKVGLPSYAEGRHGPVRCLECTIDRLMDEPEVEDTHDALAVLNEVEAHR